MNEASMNNFEKMQEEYEKKFTEENKNSIKTGIWSTLGLFKFIGQITEVYVPKLVQFLIVLSGGKIDSSLEPPGKFGVADQSDEETNNDEAPTK